MTATPTHRAMRGQCWLQTASSDNGQSRSLTSTMCTGVDLAGILGGRMASAEGGLVPSGVRCGEGLPLPSRLGSLGRIMSSPSGVRGRASTENGFWRILKATERSFLYSLRGTICISVPLLQILRGLVPPSPRNLRPWQCGVMPLIEIDMMALNSYILLMITQSPG